MAISRWLVLFPRVELVTIRRLGNDNIGKRLANIKDRFFLHTLRNNPTIMSHVELVSCRVKPTEYHQPILPLHRAF